MWGNNKNNLLFGLYFIVELIDVSRKEWIFLEYYVVECDAESPYVWLETLIGETIAYLRREKKLRACCAVHIVVAVASEQADTKVGNFYSIKLINQ